MEREILHKLRTRFQSMRHEDDHDAIDEEEDDDDEEDGFHSGEQSISTKQCHASSVKKMATKWMGSIRKLKCGKGNVAEIFQQCPPPPAPLPSPNRATHS